MAQHQEAGGHVGELAIQAWSAAVDRLVEFESCRTQTAGGAALKALSAAEDCIADASEGGDVEALRLLTGQGSARHWKALAAALEQLLPCVLVTDSAPAPTSTTGHVVAAALNASYFALSCLQQRLFDVAIPRQAAAFFLGRAPVLLLPQLQKAVAAYAAAHPSWQQGVDHLLDSAGHVLDLAKTLLHTASTLRLGAGDLTECLYFLASMAWAAISLTDFVVDKHGGQMQACHLHILSMVQVAGLALFGRRPGGSSPQAAQLRKAVAEQPPLVGLLVAACADTLVGLERNCSQAQGSSELLETALFFASCCLEVLMCEELQPAMLGNWEGGVMEGLASAHRGVSGVMLHLRPALEEAAQPSQKAQASDAMLLLRGLAERHVAFSQQLVRLVEAAQVAGSEGLGLLLATQQAAVGALPRLLAMLRAAEVGVPSPAKSLAAIEQYEAELAKMRVATARAATAAPDGATSRAALVERVEAVHDALAGVQQVSREYELGISMQEEAANGSSTGTAAEAAAAVARHCFIAAVLQFHALQLGIRLNPTLVVGPATAPGRQPPSSSIGVSGGSGNEGAGMAASSGSDEGGGSGEGSSSGGGAGPSGEAPLWLVPLKHLPVAEELLRYVADRSNAHGLVNLVRFAVPKEVLEVLSLGRVAEHAQRVLQALRTAWQEEGLPPELPEESIGGALLQMASTLASAAKAVAVKASTPTEGKQIVAALRQASAPHFPAVPELVGCLQQCALLGTCLGWRDRDGSEARSRAATLAALSVPPLLWLLREARQRQHYLNAYPEPQQRVEALTSQAASLAGLLQALGQLGVGGAALRLGAGALLLEAWAPLLEEGEGGWLEAAAPAVGPAAATLAGHCQREPALAVAVAGGGLLQLLSDWMCHRLEAFEGLEVAGGGSGYLAAGRGIGQVLRACCTAVDSLGGTAFQAINQRIEGTAAVAMREMLGAATAARSFDTGAQTGVAFVTVLAWHHRRGMLVPRMQHAVRAAAARREVPGQRLPLAALEREVGVGCAACTRPRCLMFSGALAIGEEVQNRRLLICKGCRVAGYCGVECAKADWERHQPVCRALAAVRRTAKDQGE